MSSFGHCKHCADRLKIAQDIQTCAELIVTLQTAINNIGSF